MEKEITYYRRVDGGEKMTIHTKLDDFKIRRAEEKDVSLILTLIKELAEYENLSDQVVATEETLKKFLFEEHMAEVVIGEYQEEPVALALFFHNFSTFLGRPGIYLEDLYVRPQMRGKGIGQILLSYIAKLAKERECGRLEWCCLDWNKPSIGFYKQMGAIPMEEWTTYRLKDQALNKLASKFDKD